MLSWLRKAIGVSPSPALIPDDLWRSTLSAYAFLAELPVDEQAELRALVSQFLSEKEFTGAHGLEVSDAMAVTIAAQACLPVLHLGLHWLDDFATIVVHPGAMLARREVTDDAGLVHRYNEVLLGEAMAGGPVTLSWEDVAGSGASAAQGVNVVIHEFVHKLDMRDGVADGCPPLPDRAFRQAWHDTMSQAYAEFKAQLSMADRFGGEAPWLDRYGASAPAEFFAVASEAYFVNRQRFSAEMPALKTLFDTFFLAQSRR